MCPLLWVSLFGLATILSLPAAQGILLSWCNITQQGYSFTTLGTPAALPSNAVGIKVRSDIECVAKCLLRPLTCLQIYYNISSGDCYFIPSTAYIALSGSYGGKFLTLPGTVIGNELCGVTACPGWTVCVGHCSGQYGGPKCTTDLTWCPQAPEVVNAWHYYMPRYDDDADSGIVQAVNYSKLSSTTAIRVRWQATVRTSVPTSAYCVRYYVTFNGTECSNPSAIDLLVSNEFGADYQTSSEIDGLCYGLKAGTITVAINIGACPGYQLGDSYTGLGASRSMWIWEMIQATTSTAGCGGLTYTNTQQYVASNINIQTAVIATNPAVELTSTIYTKSMIWTYLHVKWVAAVGLYSPNNSTYCSRWYATVNGSECVQVVDFVTGMFDNSTNSSRNNYQTRSMEGMCALGWVAGTYKIAIMVGSCFSGSAQPYTLTTCCGNSSRLFVAEIAVYNRHQAAKLPSGLYGLLTFFDLVYWCWSLLNTVTTAGTVTVGTYAKWTGASDLHVRAVGQTGVYGAGGCCRWYVTIDGLECSQPGPIEAVTYTGRIANYSSHGIVDGVCYGYKAGNHVVRLMAGPCTGYGISQCATGLGFAFKVTIEEVHLDRALICQSSTQCL